jgi:hypothetical protein
MDMLQGESCPRTAKEIDRAKNYLPSIGFHEIEFAEKFRIVLASSLDVRRS